MALPIFSANFLEKSLKLFEQQYHENNVFRAFSDHLKRTPENVERLDQIPFLPIEFFKDHKLYTGPNLPELEFKSSGTSEGMNHRSTHYIDSKLRYEQSIGAGFKEFFRSRTLKPLKLFALLPGYLENQHSSLIYMMEVLVKKGFVTGGEYYLNNFNQLRTDLEQELSSGEYTILLWGVSFALLDFATTYKVDLSDHIVLETGGMKGRRKELVRQELHDSLCHSFNVSQIFSEYGMTELLSQAYSDRKGIFLPPSSMTVFCRDAYDPLQYTEHGLSGALNVIDLNNRFSCAFIATQDMGRVYSSGSFEVIGRLDNSDIRGCNLMAI